tara:strand:+ start:842 stop:1435 length:594 start_codon:yes stop_codon:yes gene_type:complete
MDKKNIVTPKGVLVFPHLKSPDTKFDENGVWKTGLRLAGAEAQKLIAIIDKEIDESVAEASEKKSNVKRGAPPYKKDDETEDYIFNFKLKASGVRPNGEKWKQKPVLYDAKGNLLNSDVHVWGGTTGKVAFQPIRFHTAMIGASVSLRLKAVQIINLVEGSNQTSASSYGFGEEEGYVTTPAVTEEVETSDVKVEDF